MFLYNDHILRCLLCQMMQDKAIKISINLKAIQYIRKRQRTLR